MLTQRPACCCCSLLALLARRTHRRAASAAHPSLGTADGDALLPGFDWGVGTYGARCLGDGLSLTVDGANGWSDLDRLRSGPRRRLLRITSISSSGEGARISFVHRGDRAARTSAACPRTWADFTFERFQSGGPRFFTIQLPAQLRGRAEPQRRAGLVARRRAPALRCEDPSRRHRRLERRRARGNVDYGRWEVRTLTGRTIRTVDPRRGQL